MTYKRIAWGLAAAVLLAVAGTARLFADTMRERFRRDVMRMGFNGNLEVLHDVERGVGAERDTLARRLAADSAALPTKPYVVVSINDNRLWYRQGDQTLFTTRVATGSGKELVQEDTGQVQRKLETPRARLVQEDTGQGHWKFETPRGRLVVESKETDPIWAPPDWHYVEIAQKKKLGIIWLARNQSIMLPGGSKILVDGSNVVTRYLDGREEPFEVKEGHEIVANGNLIVPPFGTNQRKYVGTLGVNRLYLGDGYGLHGTDEPWSIGHSASHGCVRLRNEDIETLFRMVPIGTTVYIY
jgi:hypothetical protein